MNRDLCVDIYNDAEFNAVDADIPFRSGLALGVVSSIFIICGTPKPGCVKEPFHLQVNGNLVFAVESIGKAELYSGNYLGILYSLHTLACNGKHCRSH